MEALSEELVKQAYRDWESAREYFDCVSEPELVEYAAVALEAAKRKFVYMLSKSGRGA